MKNYDPFQSPTHFKLMDLLKKFDKNFNAMGKNYGKGFGPDRTVEDVMKRRQDRWNFLFIAGMWSAWTCLTTTSGAPSSASFLTRRRKGKFQFLRLQHRRGMAEHYREDAHDGHAHQMVRRAWTPRDLCRWQKRGRWKTSITGCWLKR